MRKNKPDPSRLAFRDRHKLFEQPGDNTKIANKPKMSRKLLQLEQEFGGQWVMIMIRLNSFTFLFQLHSRIKIHLTNIPIQYLNYDHF